MQKGFGYINWCLNNMEIINVQNFVIYILQIQHRTVLLLNVDGVSRGARRAMHPPPLRFYRHWKEYRWRNKQHNILSSGTPNFWTLRCLCTARRLQSYSNNMTIQVDPVWNWANFALNLWMKEDLCALCNNPRTRYSISLSICTRFLIFSSWTWFEISSWSFWKYSIFQNWNSQATSGRKI